MMSEEEIKKARAFCRLIKERTGHDFSEDNPALPMLMVLYSINKRLADKLEGQGKANQAQFDSIMKKASPEQYVFAVNGAAKEFQNGITRRWLYAFVFMLACGAGLYFWWLQSEDLDNANAILDSKREVEKAVLKRLGEDGEDIFLEFDPPGTKEKGYVQHFSEYQRQKKWEGASICRQEGCGKIAVIVCDYAFIIDFEV